MKKSPLKRRKGLTHKGTLNKESPKQEIEKAKRRLLKWELFNEQERKCKVCRRFLKWGEAELSHKIPLAQGGKTTRENCDVRCAWWLSGCHANDEHHRGNIYNEQPQWGK